MIQSQFSFSEFGFSSAIIRDLVDQKIEVADFTPYFFSIQELGNQTKRKQFSDVQRATLVEALKVQNNTVSLSELSQSNIEQLKKSNAFTITTGHQLNLLTGPLYSIYKVAQIISLTRAMNERDKNNHYVPVFWMATEDHDFEEINHIHLFGKKVEWDKIGQEEKIVGEIEIDEIHPFVQEVEEMYSDENLKKALATFTDVYKQSENLAAATRSLMNLLFGEYGLVIIDGNDQSLKKSFEAIAKREIEEGVVSNAVNKTNERLLDAGYHSQVFVRECNLFYINEEGVRQRIQKNGDAFLIDNQWFSADGLVRMLEKDPSRFSPNALLRPVYQEAILPNLAYIGGGGEIAYWLQLNGVFNELNLTFPLLRVRDSVLLLRSKEIAELEDVGFSIPDLKKDYHALLKEIAIDDVDFGLELHAEIELLETIKNQLAEKAKTVNKGLVGMIEAEFSKMEKSIQRIESKLIKAEKAKHDVKGNKIRKLQEKIYPNGGFQERYENFIPYILSDPQFISKIVDNLTAQDQPLIRVIEI